MKYITIVAVVLALAQAANTPSQLNEFLSRRAPDLNQSGKGWNDVFVIPGSSEPTRWVLLDKVHIDSFINIRLDVKKVKVSDLDHANVVTLKTAEDFKDHDVADLQDAVACIEPGMPLYMANLNGKRVVYSEGPFIKNVIEVVAKGQHTQARAVEIQQSIHDKLNIYRQTPHSFIIRVLDYGSYGNVRLEGEDISQILPDKWPMDPVRDQHAKSLLLVVNRAGPMFGYYPGAVMNVGTTSWIYDSEHDKLLKMHEHHVRQDPNNANQIIDNSDRRTGMFSGNVVLGKDLIPIEDYRHADKIPENMKVRMGQQILDLPGAAVRVFVQECGLYIKEVQSKLTAKAQKILQSIVNHEDVKLVQVVEWLANPVSPSVNFNFLFEAKGLSEEMKATDLVGSRSFGIKSFEWITPNEQEKYAIEHAWQAQHSMFQGKGQTLITSAKEPESKL